MNLVSFFYSSVYCTLCDCGECDVITNRIESILSFDSFPILHMLVVMYLYFWFYAVTVDIRLKHAHYIPKYLFWCFTFT